MDNLMRQAFVLGARTFIDVKTVMENYVNYISNCQRYSRVTEINQVKMLLVR